MSFIDSLSDDQLDALKEVGNIGSGNAATSLSMLLGCKIDMKIPAIRIVDYNEMMDLVGGAETIIVSVFLRIEGDTPGNMFFVLTPEEASHFVKQMTDRPNFSVLETPCDEMAFSALQEAGNILAGSYLSALSDFIELSIQPSVPILTIDMAGAILAEGLMELSQVSDYAIIIETIIDYHGENKQQIKGHFFLLPDPDSFSKIFNKLGVADQ
ncbi:chemotaxis protein CheC [Amphibacillus sp. MSJ-3]|uniref:chemotaxis protein CheC n=1 Tax=Amphibacillus sp. MSJ-3 TaxID=2841505 RepID=UPI001C0EEE1F|nr:chemotaxis protein CheC [Amphibacillus sp. MSJ-3]MBU5594981.1 chemotaxis protein CheC [Amphibacillus sp. MSJ-3]